MHFFISAAIWYGEGWKSICQYTMRGCGAVTMTHICMSVWSYALVQTVNCFNIALGLVVGRLALLDQNVVA